MKMRGGGMPVLIGVIVSAAIAGGAVAGLDAYTRPAVSLSGYARVIDGDTIVINGTHIRLAGIDSPERSQTCEGRDGNVYECGRDASSVMAELIRGQRVECVSEGPDRYGRTLATCRTERGELNAEMVRRGWAVPYMAHGRYRVEMGEAKAASLGIWSGRFEMPAEWRRAHK
jgi:endonuclease YncB( thermonuclease family)